MNIKFSRKKVSQIQYELTRSFFLCLNKTLTLNFVLYCLDKIGYYYGIMKCCAYFPTNKCLTIDKSVQIKYRKNISIGKNVRIGPGSTLGGLEKICIGDDVVISKNVLIETAGLNYTMFPYIHCGKPIVIGSRVWIGAGAMILGGVTINDDSVIGAGAIITKNVPSNVIVVNENKLKFINKTTKVEI